MEKNYIQYNHHGIDVFVREDLKGTHRNMCLCYACKKFKHDNPEEKCKAANALFEFLKASDAILVAPVIECAQFEEAFGDEIPELEPPKDY